MFRLRKMHLIYVYVPVFTLNNFFLLVLVCSYEYWQVQVYFTLLFIPQHNPLCREPAICISRWNLLRTSGWRRRLASFPGTIRTVQEHLDPGQSFGPVMSTRAVKRCILSQTVIYKGNQRNSSHKYKCLSQVCMSYLL